MIICFDIALRNTGVSIFKKPDKTYSDQTTLVRECLVDVRYLASPALNKKHKLWGSIPRDDKRYAYQRWKYEGKIFWSNIERLLLGLAGTHELVMEPPNNTQNQKAAIAMGMQYRVFGQLEDHNKVSSVTYYMPKTTKVLMCKDKNASKEEMTRAVAPLVSWQFTKGVPKYKLEHIYDSVPLFILYAKDKGWLGDRQ